MSIIQLAAVKAKKQYIYQLALQHQHFDSAEAVDQNLLAFMAERGAQLKPSTLKLLDHLMRHSHKIPGVSFGTINYIVKSTGLSESSVHNALQELEKNGVIVRIPTTAPSGRQGTNIIVIQHYVTKQSTAPDTLNYTPDKTPDCTQSVGAKPIQDKALEVVLEVGSNKGSKDTKKEFDIDIEYICRKLDDPVFLDSKLYKHVVLRLNVPSALHSPIYDRLVHDLNMSDHESDKVIDLHEALRRSTSKFKWYYQSGHRISCVGTFFVAIFKDHIERLRILRESEHAS